jgi:hypothetical protein
MPYSHSHLIRVKYSPTEITVIGFLVDGILESKFVYIFRPNEGAVAKNVALEFRPLLFRFSVHIKMYINLRSNIPSTNNSSTITSIERDAQRSRNYILFALSDKQL